ncbi:hydroxymethylbilane synthase [Arthrobacter zhangbolii]|uniref:Porphobilinogen deaminase n=1 Tax=Arthrobacter zhangbolii TaxID=2886936 RepID=A0A9X1MAC9_9MICC|nr:MULTISPECIES: hydroxymethylbilane synthase [Arthrobacter]MCC3273961.1 hydroxymethylbilane synthase [Arthrobacter zhangbolii]MCC3294877.1 hydroxymethylbilane synthase [Arthrobacter zhangbolii]MDN3903927.1 hydroxymethylbilane synthase [Arthrobacter sp. YD2]UON91308.1 hydroxymethylbilane synthase [Arthrobacter zhangbolii]
MAHSPVLIGTRGSALAVTQTTTVSEALSALGGFDVELVRVRTEGDINRAALSQIGGTGVFVAALRESLLRGDCDVAVHSLKDLPTAAAPGLALGAIPERVDVRDVLCARDGLTLAELPAGAKIGTGSPRRAAQLRAARPDLEIVDIRGNVDTRLGRVAGLVAGAPGDLDAVVLAAAGLARLGRLGVVTEFIDPAVMLPAPGQGALAVECRTADAEDGALAKALQAYDHRDSRLTVAAERAMLGRLEAGCTAPVGALAHVEEGTISLEAVVCSDDGTRLLRRSAAVADLSEDAARALGVQVAEELLAAGAGQLTDLPAS